MKTQWIFGLIFLAACSNDSSKSEYVSAVVADSMSEKELQESLKEFELEEKKRIEEEKKNTTSLQFEKLKHDFGNVKAFSENTYQFKVTNTGNCSSCD
jgi:hypothetical protein